jgi:hypothetical protein
VDTVEEHLRFTIAEGKYCRTVRWLAKCSGNVQFPEYTYMKHRMEVALGGDHVRNEVVIHHS